MPILKHMILLGNILSVLTLVRYLYVAFIVFVLGFGNTSGFGVLAFLALFFLSFYPIIVILCTLYSWLSRNDEKIFRLLHSLYSCGNCTFILRLSSIQIKHYTTNLKIPSDQNNPKNTLFTARLYIT